MGSPLLTLEEAETKFDLPAGVYRRFVRDGIIPGSSALIQKTLVTYIDEGDAEFLAEFRNELKDSILAGEMLLQTWPLPRPRTSGVYFIASGEAVKIGVAGCIQSRHKALQTSSPTKLLLLGWEVAHDRRALEVELHRRFASSRLSGEWFQMTEDLEAYLSDIAKSYWGLRGYELEHAHG